MTDDFAVVSTIADALGIGMPDKEGQFSATQLRIWNQAIDVADALYSAGIVRRP